MQRVTSNSIRLGPTQILEAACAARDLARVEEAMLTVMRAGRSDPQDDELLSTAAKVVWDIVSDSGTVDERERELNLLSEGRCNGSWRRPVISKVPTH